MDLFHNILKIYIERKRDTKKDTDWKKERKKEWKRGRQTAINWNKITWKIQTANSTSNLTVEPRIL